MELFSVERYIGETSSAPCSSAKEQRRMKKLIEQAKGRKRQRENDDVMANYSNSVVQDTSEVKEQVGIGKVPKVKAKRKEDGGIAETLENGKETCEKTDVGNQDIVDNMKGNIPSDQILNSHNGSEDAQKIEPKCNEEMTIIGGNARKKQPEAVRRVLPLWLANPVYFADNVQDNLLPVCELDLLDNKLLSRLQDQGIQHFFPVQHAIIPDVLACWEEQSPFGRGGFLPPDICVCAPTGSGKTLAYVLPIVQLLQSSIAPRLEVLVIVPTKDLATQVWKVFNVYAAGTGVKVGLANGLKSLLKEQQQLGEKSSAGFSSNVNILVATPGRLVEHLLSSSGFTLQFLRFFVIDEADRLLAEPYFGWLSKVYSSVYSTSTSVDDYRTAAFSIRVPAPRLTPSWSCKIKRPLQKLLFSATITQNPEKLAPLQLYKPKFYTVSRPGTAQDAPGASDVFSIGQTPSTLHESMYICNNGGKPLVLLYLLAEMGLDRVLCFTSSVETTHRLYLLVKHFGGIAVAEFSSTLSGMRRQAILNDFSSGKTKLIICSDAMSRGLDLERVQYVVSYDPPVSLKTYIHRVGRTARAGRTGTAITMLHDAEVFHFKKMLKSLNKSKVPKHCLKDDVLQPLTDRYEEALEKLKDEVVSDKKSAKGTKNTQKRQ